MTHPEGAEQLRGNIEDIIGKALQEYDMYSATASRLEKDADWLTNYWVQIRDSSAQDILNVVLSAIEKLPEMQDERTVSVKAVDGVHDDQPDPANTIRNQLRADLRQALRSVKNG